MSETSVNRDLAGTCARMVAWWGPGVALILITADLGWWWRVAGWSLGLAWFGGLCLVNAARCGRLHCYFTGPFYLTMSALVVAVGFHLVSFGQQSWNLIALATLLGWILFTTIPEWIWGRYRTVRVPPSP
ncbi:MAG: hypothetical protein GC166_13660 [Alphaproteobacteria bacterium]|nr:hypothetical protein [Alphaproteobacteria bacterium]